MRGVRSLWVTLALAACSAGETGPTAVDGGTGDSAPREVAAPVDLSRMDPCVATGTCPPGVWTNVTPPGMAPADLRPAPNAFGPGTIVGDPARPIDLYVGGSKSGLWKSSDYGNGWTKINSQIPDVARGAVIAVAGTTPATLWAAGYNTVLKSTDGGMTFRQTSIGVSLYSIVVDPGDPDHLISGLHEADGIVESRDGGATWRTVGGAGFPAGGVSWYPFFLRAGDPASTRRTWFAIAQGGGSPVITGDGGATWTVPQGLRGLQHPHGNAQIYQNGATIFVAGTSGPGQGVYRSTDMGLTFARVDSGQAPQAVVWGTPKNVYAMYAWACSNCNLGTQFEIAPQPGVTWSKGTVPPALVIGPNSLVVTSDGTRQIFVGLMWDQGLWRYVEP